MVRLSSLDPGLTNRTLGPKDSNCSAARFLAPCPTPTIAITEALPIMMPNIVRLLRILLATRVEVAILKLSMIFTVVLYLY